MDYTDLVEVNFFPAHTGLTVNEHLTLVYSYEAWLNTQGEEHQLYVWSIGKYSLDSGKYSSYSSPLEVAVYIYDEPTAITFKLKFGL